MKPCSKLKLYRKYNLKNKVKYLKYLSCLNVRIYKYICTLFIYIHIYKLYIYIHTYMYICSIYKMYKHFYIAVTYINCAIVLLLSGSAGIVLQCTIKLL